jgi:hypothetical protein
MASNTIIQIRRSNTTSMPSNLYSGELAYSYASNTLFIGTSDANGAIEIGHYSNLTNLTAGTYGDTTHIPIITVDGHGTVTNVYTSEISTSLSINADSGGPNNVSLITDTLDFYGGDGITTSINRDTAGVANVTFDLDGTVIRANGAGSSTNQTIDGILNISGDLNVSGNLTYTDVETIVSQNSLIKLANNNIYSDVVDIGFYGESNNGSGLTYTGLFRHAGDAGKDYYLFDGYTGPDPDANNFVINPSDPSFTISTLHANLISQKVESSVFLANQGLPDGTANAGYSFSGNEGGYDSGMFSPTDGELFFYSNNEQIIQVNTSGIKVFKPITFDAGQAILHDTSNHSLLFGTGVQDTGSSQRITIGYQPDTQTGQSWDAIAIGSRAGTTNQSDNAIAIGNRAGYTGQGTSAVAIGGGDGGNGGAGQINQGYSAVAIGNHAGYDTQGQYSVALGAYAGQNNQVQNSIAINASGSALNPTEAGLYINPIRNDVNGGNVTAYNTSTKELVNTNVAIGSNGITLANGTNINDGESGLFVDSLNFSETGNIVFYNTTTKEVSYGNMADLRPDAISNGSYIWTVSGDDGHLFSDSGTQIADSSTNTLIGQGLDLTNSNTGRVAVGYNAGNYSQGNDSVAVGHGAGQDSQNYFSTAVGYNAGNSGQGTNAVAIGHAAAQTSQSNHGVAIGFAAGNSNQGYQATAIGRRAGHNYQGDYAVAMGPYAGAEYQNNYTVAIGYYAGNDHQHHGSIAIGDYAGAYYQTTDSIAIGHSAGENYNTGNGWAPISMGRFAGQEYSGSQSIAIGNYAGNSNVGYHAVALGPYAARNGSGEYAVAIGDSSGNYAGNGTIAIGYESGYQANNYSIAIGYEAGWDDSTPLGDYQIAIGAYAAQTYGADYAIVLNASGSDLSPQSSGFYVNPVRYEASQDATDDGLVFYNQTTKEFRYSYALDGGSF